MSIPVVLTIAGSDNSAGAGAQADLKAISANGCYAVTAITCVVAEVPGKVSAIHPIPPAIVAEQIRLLFRAYPIAAIKTGMLYSTEIIHAILAALDENSALAPGGSHPPLVVDPVMVATSGDPLLRDDAIALYRERLFPRAALITPNLDEVRALLGAPITSLAEMRTAGIALAAETGTAFLIKGGHLATSEATDLLCLPDGSVLDFSSPRVSGVSTHGTGCTTSAAIAAGLGRGLSLRSAVAEAKGYITRAIRTHHRWQRPDGTTDALNHFAE